MRTKLEPILAVLAPVAVSVALYVLFTQTSLDDRCSDPFFDRETKTWIYKNAWWANDVLHKRGRDLVFVTAVVCLVVAAFGGFWPRVAAWRRSALFLTLGIALSAGVAGFLKHRSPVPGPWEATRYGGPIPHLSPFAEYPPGLELGGCFPGAHAAGAFAFMGLYYVLRERDKQRAWLALAAGYALGLAFGAVQVIRGAHFQSHNFGSAVLVSVLLAALYWIPFRGRLHAARASDSGIARG